MTGSIRRLDGVIADGFNLGPRRLDNKGNLYSMLEAAEAMAKSGFRPKRTIYFALAMTRQTPALPVPKASRHCWPRAASGSISWSTRGC